MVCEGGTMPKKSRVRFNISLGHVRSLLVWVTLLLVGAWVGMIVAMLVMGGDINRFIMRFAPGVVGGLITLALFSAAARWVIFPNARKKLGGVIESLVDRERTLREKRDDPELRVDVVEVVSTYFAGRAFYGMAIVIGGIVGSLLLAGQLVTMLEQNKKLDEQNTLLNSQNSQITRQSEAMREQNALALYNIRAESLARRTLQEREAALVSLNQVTAGLNPDLPVEVQLAALQRVPEVMSMGVTVLDGRVDPGASPDPNAPLATVVEYPNMQVLGEALLAFAREPRRAWDDRVGEVSTMICVVLTQLSVPFEYADGEEASLWALLFDRTVRTDLTRVPEGVLEQGISHVRSQCLDELAIDLSHMGDAQLDGFQLPHMDFSGADLSFTTWKNAVLDFAEFDESTTLTGVSFENTKARFASFNGATLNGSFDYTDLSFANFVGAVLELGVFSYTKLVGAELHYSDLIVEEAFDIDFRAARFLDCDFSRASFYGVDFRGTRFRSCRFVSDEDPTQTMQIYVPILQWMSLTTNPDGRPLARSIFDNQPWFSVGSIQGISSDQLVADDRLPFSQHVISDGLDFFTDEPSASEVAGLSPIEYQTFIEPASSFDGVTIRIDMPQGESIESLSKAIRAYLMRNVIAPDPLDPSTLRPFDPSMLNFVED